MTVVECVYQVYRQYPNYFEFNEAFLICLIDQLYSCRFGTFLGDCEKERVDLALANRTASLWEFMERYRSCFISPMYVRYEGHLSVNTQASSIVIWDTFYHRWKLYRSELVPSPHDVATRILLEARRRIERLENERKQSRSF